MNDIICISSSDDEESEIKQVSNVRKRKRSCSPKKEKENKMFKTNSINQVANNNSTAQENISPKKEKENEMFKTNSISQVANDICTSQENISNTTISNPRPGTSKQCDVENDKFQKNSTKKVIKPQLVIKKKVEIPDPTEDVFKKLLDICEQKKNSDDTRKILKNLKKDYDQLSLTEKNTEEFRILLNNSIKKVSNDYNNRFYAYIREVKDEIKRRINNTKLLNTNNNNQQDTEEKDEIEISEEDMNRIKLLEKTINKCKNKICELESKEVDFDDEENSTYLQEDRYKRKLVELCNEYIRIVGDKPLKNQIYKKQLKRKDIPDEMTGISSVDEAIISFINTSIKEMNKLKHIKRPTAVANYLKMPDYHDILQCIIECNKNQNLELKQKKMEKLAETAFKSIVSHLKKQRIQETEEYISSFIELETGGDPAAKNTELNEKLQRNKKDGDNKLEEIFSKYVEKQEGLSTEELKKLDSEDSVSDNVSEDESCNESKKSESNDSNKVNLTVESDVDSESVDKTKMESEESNQNLKTKEVISEKDNIISDTTDKKYQESIKDTVSNIIATKKVGDVNESRIVDNVKEMGSQAEENQRNITPVVKKVYDEIEILSDEDEYSAERDVINKLRSGGKVKCTVMRNDQNSIAGDKENIINKKDTACDRINVSKDAKHNIHHALPSIKPSLGLPSLKPNLLNVDIAVSDVCNIVNNIPKDGDNCKIKQNITEVIIVNDDVETRNGDKIEKNAIQDKSFIKVCPFAKTPKSWKDSLSPVKGSKPLQLPIQQVLEDLSKTQCVDLTEEKKQKLPSTSVQFDSTINNNRTINKTNNINVSSPTVSKKSQLDNSQVKPIIKADSNNLSTISNKTTKNGELSSLDKNKEKSSRFSLTQCSDKHVNKS